MKKIVPILFLMLLVTFVVTCNKDESEVDQLEQDVMEAENRELMPDSSKLTAEDSVSQDYAMTEQVETVEEPVTYDQTEYGGYTVQVAAGVDRKMANYTAEIYSERGYDPFVNEAMVNDTLYYRIRIGNFETIEEARALAAELKDRFSTEVWVDLNE